MVIRVMEKQSHHRRNTPPNPAVGPNSIEKEKRKKKRRKTKRCSKNLVLFLMIIFLGLLSGKIRFSAVKKDACIGLKKSKAISQSLSLP